MLRRTAKAIDPKYANPFAITTGAVLGKGKNQEEYVVTKVFYRNSNYAIFEVNDSGYIEYVTVDDTLYNTQAICIPLNRINFWLEDTADNNLRDFQESLADTIAQCFDGRPAEALVSIAQLEAFIKSEVFKYSKLIYIFSFFVLCLFIVGGALICKASGKIVPDTMLLIYMCTMGALGGLFSVARNMENYNVEIKTFKTIPQTIWAPYWVGIITRLSISIIGALLVYLLARSDFFSFQNTINPYVLMTLAVIAGFSETFIPNLLTKFETNVSAGEPIRVKSGTVNPSLGQAAFNPLHTNVPNIHPRNLGPGTGGLVLAGEAADGSVG